MPHSVQQLYRRRTPVAGAPAVGMLLDVMTRLTGSAASDAAVTLPNYHRPADSTSDAISAIPLDRWDCDRLLLPNIDANTAGVAGRFGGFVGQWAGFDAAAFGVSPSEAALMDPQQRLLLEVRCVIERPG